ncbi:MAG: phosphotransferase [Eubacteriales bacterium]
MNDRLEKLMIQAGWDTTECEADDQYLGATNASFACVYRGKKYVCRLASESSDILAINRKAEYAALKVVSELGLGATLVYFDTETGNMITSYIEGRTVTGVDYGSLEFIKRTAEMMKRLHKLKTEFVFDPIADIERKITYIKERIVPLHNKFADVYRIYLEISSRYPKEESAYTGLCHGDPFANNFILSDDSKIYLIDYEFAGMCDVFYDLACMISWYPQEKKEFFLTAYFGYCDEAMLKRVRDFNYIQLFWNGTWAYVKSCDPSANEFDYLSFGHQHIDMLLGISQEYL